MEAGLQYILKASLSPITLQVRFADCCTGTWFQEVVVELEDLGPCCGINFDLGVEFGVDYKAVSLIPKLAGWGEGCLEIYGDVDWFEEGTVSFDGIRFRPGHGPPRPNPSLRSAGSR